MTDYYGDMPIIKPYIAPTYRSETKVTKTKVVKCDLCGSTAIDHTQAQCKLDRIIITNNLPMSDEDNKEEL